ncbi:MAG: IS110 family transposase [Bdellovibrionales bacterium]|nr:IS110 family transposase [Bdellovibrionales bacterium]
MKYKVLIGLDWADRKHDGCISVSGKLERFQLKHTPENIHEWVCSLKKRFRGEKFAVVLELKSGPLFTALLKYDCFDLYPLNPKTLSEYRKAFSPSGAKDDPTDAEFMLEILERHPERLSVWRPQDPKTRELQILVEQRRTLVNDRKRVGNRLTSLLKGYFPLVLQLFPKMGRTILSEFLLCYPTLSMAQAASEQELIAFFRKHRSYSRIKSKITLIKKAMPITEDPVLIETSALTATAYARQILAMKKSEEEFEKRISVLFESHKDAKLFSSLPATGEHTAPRLLAAFGTDRDSFHSASEFQCYAGIAPVLERSGKESWTHWRFLCNKFLRQSIHEWAGITIQHSLWARAFYAMQRKKGKSHPKAIRALSYKWIRIIFRLWKNNDTYSEQKYLMALQRTGSPIITFLAQNKNLEKLSFSNTYT